MSTGKIIEIYIPGDPVALKRHRTAVRGKHAIQYDPKENKDWKAYCATFMLEAMSGLEPLAGPVRLIIECHFAMPKSRWLKKSRRLGSWHTKKPDLSNLEKGIEDAANGILWHDDSQVCWKESKKILGDQGSAPYTTVKVVEMP